MEREIGRKRQKIDKKRRKTGKIRRKIRKNSRKYAQNDGKPAKSAKYCGSSGRKERNSGVNVQRSQRFKRACVACAVRATVAVKILK